MRCSIVITTILVVVLSSVVQEREAVPVHLAPRSAAPWYDGSYDDSWWEKSSDPDPYGRGRDPVVGTPIVTFLGSVDVQMKLNELKQLKKLMEKKKEELEEAKEKGLKELEEQMLKEWKELKLKKEAKKKELKEMQGLKLDDVKLVDLK